MSLVDFSPCGHKELDTTEQLTLFTMIVKPILLLLEQYMAHIDKAREYNIELAADFLEMASTLLYIKSCSLLPKEEVPEEDPKAELEQRLQEYARCKKAAEMLSENSMYGKVYFREAIHEELPKPQANYSYSPLALMSSLAE